jgi:hypothetical protein
MRIKMRQMQEQMNKAQGNYNAGNTTQESPTRASTTSTPKGDYIDFEEVK